EPRYSVLKNSYLTRHSNPDTVKAMHRSNRVMAGALGGLAVVGALLGSWGWLRTQLVDRAAADEVQKAAERLGASLQTAAGAARTRAETLAALPMVRAGVETDPDTVRDLARSSPAFTAAAGETIELHQLQAEQVVSLLRVPPDARAIHLNAEH